MRVTYRNPCSSCRARWRTMPHRSSVRLGGRPGGRIARLIPARPQRRSVTRPSTAASQRAEASVLLPLSLTRELGDTPAPSSPPLIRFPCEGRREPRPTSPHLRGSGMETIPRQPRRAAPRLLQHSRPHGQASFGVVASVSPAHKVGCPFVRIWSVGGGDYGWRFFVLGYALGLWRDGDEVRRASVALLGGD